MTIIKRNKQNKKESFINSFEGELIKESSINSKLSELVKEYYKHNETKKDLDKSLKIINAEIKKLMKGNNFEVDDLIATKTIQERKSLNEEKLIECLKESEKKYKIQNNCRECSIINRVIKTREYVDTDELETIIHEELVDPKDLKEAQEIQEIVVLKVTKKNVKNPFKI